jgi:serine phosphatase RsbU (regulator of sigma subunit)
MNFTKFIVTFIVIINTLSAQNKRIDSLLALVAKTSNDSLKLDYYQVICKLCDIKDNLKYGRITDSIADKLILQSKSETEKTKFIQKKLFAQHILIVYYGQMRRVDMLEKTSLKCLELAKSTKDFELIKNATNDLIENYIRMYKITKAMNLLLTDLKNSEAKANPNEVIYYLEKIGGVYSRIHNNEKGLSYELKALEIQKNVADSTALHWIYFTVGKKYANVKDNNNALYYYLKSYNFLKRSINNRQKIKHLFYIAGSYGKIGKSEEAKKHYLEALQFAKNLDNFPQDSIIVGDVYNEIGSLYFNEKDYEKALEYKLKGISCINNLSDGDAFNPYLTTGDVYFAIKKYDLAEKYVMKAKKIAENRVDLHNQKAVAKTLSDIYNAKGNKVEANEYLVIYYELKDSLDRAENQDELIYKELNYENEKNELKLLSEQKIKDQKTEEEKEKQKIIIVTVSLGLLLVIIFSGFMFNRFKITNKQNKLITEQKSILEHQKQEITDSINYSKRIQTAILPDLNDIKHSLSDFFILYQPKDIVSGDFYYFNKVNNDVFIAAADCTGHGVPGAFMSLVGSKELKIANAISNSPAQILKHLNNGVKDTLRQNHIDGTKDGMDIALVRINGTTVRYSAANRPLWILKKDSVIIEEIKATKTAIAGFTEDNFEFEEHEINLAKGDTIYLFSDGYADQFGGDKQKKMTTKRFREFIMSIKDKSMHEQQLALVSFFNSWQGNTEQVDDLLIIGIRL